jgi:DNA replication protein DnaC
LPTVARQLAAAARRARDAGSDYEEFLHELLESEVRERADKSAARLLKRAAFPDLKTLDQLNWQALEGISVRRLWS